MGDGKKAPILGKWQTLKDFTALSLSDDRSNPKNECLGAIKTTLCAAATVSSAQRVGFFNIGLGRVLDKILGSGSGRSGKKYNRVFPGIFFSFGYFRVFRVFPGMSGIFGYFRVYQYILGLSSNI